MLILLSRPSGANQPVTSHATVLSALAPKSITKLIIFFKIVTLIMFVCLFIKMEVIFLNNVNLTDCLISTLILKWRFIFFKGFCVTKKKIL